MCYELVLTDGLMWYIKQATKNFNHLLQFTSFSFFHDYQMPKILVDIQVDSGVIFALRVQICQIVFKGLHVHI